jgi:hypothetical protein
MHYLQPDIFNTDSSTCTFSLISQVLYCRIAINDSKITGRRNLEWTPTLWHSYAIFSKSMQRFSNWRKHADVRKWPEAEKPTHLQTYLWLWKSELLRTHCQKLFYPDDRNIRFLEKLCLSVPLHGIISHKKVFSYSPLWESQISKRYNIPNACHVQCRMMWLEWTAKALKLTSGTFACRDWGKQHKTSCQAIASQKHYCLSHFTEGSENPWLDALNLVQHLAIH